MTMFCPVTQKQYDVYCCANSRVANRVLHRSPVPLTCALTRRQVQTESAQKKSALRKASTSENTIADSANCSSEEEVVSSASVDPPPPPLPPGILCLDKDSNVKSCSDTLVETGKIRHVTFNPTVRARLFSDGNPSLPTREPKHRLKELVFSPVTSDFGNRSTNLTSDFGNRLTQRRRSATMPAIDAAVKQLKQRKQKQATTLKTEDGKRSLIMRSTSDDRDDRKSTKSINVVRALVRRLNSLK